MNRMQYTIQRGDSLFTIGQKFEMPIQMIVALNPHLDPQNLRIGEIIWVCPGYSQQQNQMPENMDMDMEDAMPEYDSSRCAEQMSLSNELRMLWEQHILWTREFIISLLEDSPELPIVRERLLRNAPDMGNVFAQYYGTATGNAIADLIKEHLMIGEELVTAVKNADTEAANDANERWYENGDQIAATLASLNPYFDEETLREMWATHLDQVKQEVSARMTGDYAADIANYDEMEQHALDMADYLSQGITEQLAN